MKAIFEKGKLSNDYSDALNRASNNNYAGFFAQCKDMKKSGDSEARAKGKALEKSYRLFFNNGVPFTIAQIIYPALCKIHSDYVLEHAKIMEAEGKSNEKS